MSFRLSRAAKLGVLALISVTACACSSAAPAVKGPGDPLTHVGTSDAVYRWGSYLAGADLRQGTPTQVPNLTGVTALAASNSSNYALLGNGQVWAWGDGMSGQLGDNSSVASASTPVKVDFPAGTTIKAIGEGYDTGYAVDSQGHGWSWGGGALCVANAHDLVPNEVQGLSDLVAVSGGGKHAMWLTASGTVYTCGSDNSGQLGTGGGGYADLPTEVTGLPAGDPVTAISAGNSFSTVLLANGEVWDWGQGNHGQLGNGVMLDEVVPVRVRLPVGTHATQIYAGGDLGTDGHQVAMLSNGEAVAWGDDRFGQLGDGRRLSEAAPVPITVPTGVTFTFVAAGGASSYAVDSSGHVWAWGANANGQLGRGSLRSAVAIEVDSNVALLSATARDVIDYHS